MRTVLFRVIVVMLMAGVCVMAQPNGGPSAPREVLVKFRTLAPGAVQQIVQDEDIDLAKGVGGNGVMRLRSRSNNTADLVARLQARADVEYAEPNYVVYAIETIPNETSWGSLWGMQKIGAAAAWDTSKGSQNTVVGVIDTGVDYNHGDLAANIWSAPDGFTVTIGGTEIACPQFTHGYNAIAGTCYPMDDNGHGTHVSGTVGAVGNNGLGVVGVNWTTSIMGLKFLGADGSGYTSDAVDAIEFAIQVKAKFGATANVRVLSNSWGGGSFSQALLDQINKANEKDMLFVAAAGNNGQNTDRRPHYPSSYSAPNVVSVAATDSNDALASFSNYGASSVDLAAPGVGILSTLPSGVYGSYSGTSMATPHVSGAAALVLSACSLGTSALKSNLMNTVDYQSSLDGKTVTGGRLNVGTAIATCSVAPLPADFSLSASPSSLKITPGGAASYTVTITPVNGFADPVTTTLSAGPLGATCKISPSTITSPYPAATLTVVTSPSTRRATYTIVITGTGKGLTRTTSVKLVVAKK